VYLKCVPFLYSGLEGEFYGQQFCTVDLHLSGGKVAGKTLQPSPCLDTAAAHTLRLSDCDPSAHLIQTSLTHYVPTVSRPTFRLSVGLQVIALCDRLDRRCFVWVGPAHCLWLLASLVLFVKDSSYRPARREVVVHLLSL